MKRFLTILMAGLLIGALTAPALAWEFEMKGDWQYRYRYFGRTGGNDLFGVVALQEGPTAAAFAAGAIVNNVFPGAGATASYVGFAGPNYWGRGATLPATVAPDPTNAGTMVTRGGFSTWGSDASYLDQRLRMHMTIRVNQVLRVHGQYNVGGIRNEFAKFDYAPFANVGGIAIPNGRMSVGAPPFEQWMPINANNTSSLATVGIGSWEQLRATFNTPWAIFSIGMKDFPYGTGLWTTDRLRGTSFLMVVPYGPFRFFGAYYITNNFQNGAGSWNFVPEGEDKADYFPGFLFTYDQADMTAGGGWQGRMAHASPGARFAFNPAPPFVTPQVAPAGARARDDMLHVWTWFLKYFNGRFFANAEYGWYTFDRTSIGAREQHREGYHTGAEIGTVVGPAKVSLVWAQASGPVANNSNPTKTYDIWPVESKTFLGPYQYLMFDQYAGGNQTYAGVFLADDGTGLMGDAYVFGARLDYAVAANLNVWGSYLWAHRLESVGYLFGNYDSAGVANQTLAGARALRALYGGTNPYVDDGYMGWEANAGVDWKLLEGLTLRMRYAYWQPGEWFQQAYRSVGMRNGAVVNDAMFLGKDAIQAFEGLFMIEF